MSDFEKNAYYIIGMSPGNSYFKDEEITYLLKTSIERFGRVAILIADIPAISTYIALGYTENRARRDKAIPKGNALKNRVRKVMKQLGYADELVKIIDWEKEIQSNDGYLKEYQKIEQLYKANTNFRKSANSTTQTVLESAGKQIENLEKATEIGVHYLLSELAFLNFAPSFFCVNKAIYIYHKNWPVFEDYISGKFDNVVKPELDFFLLENPYETFNPTWDLEENEVDQFANTFNRIKKTKTIRIGFNEYVPAFIQIAPNKFSGIFYEIIMEIATAQKWQVIFTEETGYGVIIDGLESNRFDLFGSTVWPTPERLAKADFSIPLYQSNVYAWVRAGFDKTNDEIKRDESIRVAIKENDISDSLANVNFPTNRRVRVPQLSNTVGLLQSVADNKADFTFAEPNLIDCFNKTSKIKLVASSKEAIEVFDNCFMFKRGEKEFKKFLNEKLEELLRNGFIDRLIKKYGWK